MHEPPENARGGPMKPPHADRPDHDAELDERILAPRCFPSQPAAARVGAGVHIAELVRERVAALGTCREPEDQP